LQPHRQPGRGGQPAAEGRGDGRRPGRGVQGPRLGVIVSRNGRPARLAPAPESRRGEPMRPVVPALVVCAVLLVLTGCPPTPFLRPDQADRIPAETPTANQLAWEVNDNARRLQAVEARDLEISAKGGGQAIDLVDANMSCAKPRYFSLQAT